MKTLVLSILTCAITFSVYAQDIKVKKGAITINNNVIASIKEEKNGYLFSSPDGSPIITVYITSYTKGKVQTPEEWLICTSPDGKTFELPNPKDRLLFSFNKIYTHKLFDSNPQLLTTDGLDKNTITKLFEEGKHAFSHKWDSIYSVLKDDEKKEEELIANKTFVINNAGEIISNKNIIGKVFVNKSTMGSSTYYIKDVKGNQIAKLETSSWLKSSNFSQITTCDNKPLMFLAYNSAMQLSTDDIALHLVAKLLSKGYPLGDMTEDIKARLENNAKKKEEQALEKEKQQVKAAMESSVNIYNTPGKVILTDGTTSEGNITIIFESIEKKMGRSGSGIIDLDAPALGTTALLTQKDVNGNKTEKKYKASEGVMIHLSNRSFLGTKGSKDGVLNNVGGSSSINIGTRRAQFFEVLYNDGKENLILQHPLDEGELYLKLKDKQEAIYLGNKAMLGSRSEKTKAKLTTEYLQCPSIDATKYNTTTFDGLKQLIADYCKACGK
ncbi:MAG: hypothetical protein ACTTHI_05220 [Prevotella sp.]